MAFTDILKKKKSPALEFKVGEGLTLEETQTAYRKITAPDLALEAQKNSFWGQFKNEFSIREEPVEVRRMFEAEPIETKAPPIVTQLGSLGFALAEAIPRLGATIYGEFIAPERKTGKVNLGFNAKRLGYEESTYPTGAKEVQDCINAGGDPITCSVRTISNKTLDLAFGAQLTTQVLKTIERQLLKGGIEARMGAWETLGRPATIEEAQANKVAQTSQALQNTKNLPLPDREKIVSKINNTLNKSVKTLTEKGIPTIADTAKIKVAKVAEVVSRETPFDKNFWGDIAKPDIKIKITPLAEVPVAGQLPGTREVPGQAPAFGLSTKEVENVGYGKSQKRIAHLEGNISDATETIKGLEIQLENSPKEAKKYLLERLASEKKGIELFNKEIKEIKAEVLDVADGNWFSTVPDEFWRAPRLTAENMNVGDVVMRGTSDNSLTITEVLGGGKFKAVPVGQKIGEKILKPKETIKQKTIRQASEITYKQVDEIAKKLKNENISRETLEKLKIEIDIADEIIEQMPGKELIRFVSRKTGQFEDFGNPSLAKTPIQAEKIRARNAFVTKTAESAFEGTKYADQFDNSDSIREAIADYIRLRDKLKVLKTDATGVRQELSAVRRGEYLMQLAKGNRRAAYRALTESFNLTDTEVAKIRQGKDIMAMTREEFDDFMFKAESEAEQIVELSEARIQLKGTVYNLELKKWENLQEAMKLPPIDQMSAEELRAFDAVLSQYKQADEFLTTRQLETIDKTELTGLKTVREVLDHLAKKTGVTPELAGIAKPHPWMYDTQLQRQDPFNKLLVDKYNVSYLRAAERAIKLERENDKLVRAARKSRSTSILQKLIPTDKKIREWLEAEPAERIKLVKEMTLEELKVAEFQDIYFKEVYDWMGKRELERNFSSRFEDKYYPHIRRGFLEAWKDDGFIKAFGEATKQFRQDEDMMTILNEKTGEILPFQKWVKFEQFRSGELIPSQNVALSFKTYVHAIEKAKQFDEFIPEMMIYAHTLSPRLTTARGIEMDDRIQQFFKKWINSKKGRVEKQIITPGSKADWALRTSVALLRIRDLGLNLATQVASTVGEQAGNVIMLRTKYPIGVARLATAQGRAITKKYENFVGKSIYERFTEASADVGDKLMTGIMGLFGSATRKANQTFLLSMMTKEEFQSGIISVERLAELRNKMGRYRVVEGAESLIGKSAEMAVVKQHKKWAIPMIVTTSNNFKILAKNVRKNGIEAIKSEEGAELFTATLLTSAIALGSYGYYQDLKEKGIAKRNFIEDLIFKMTREALSLIGALDPRFIVGFTKPRLVSFLLDISNALTSIAKLEEYKTGDREGELKGIQAFKRTITPVVVSQLLPEEQTKGETEFERLKKLSPSEANAIMKEYKKSDPPLYRKVKNLKEDEDLEITEKDKEIRNMGVENFERARHIYQQAIELDSRELQNTYIKELRKKKIISDEVLKQIKALKSGKLK